MAKATRKRVLRRRFLSEASFKGSKGGPIRYWRTTSKFQLTLLRSVTGVLVTMDLIKSLRIILSLRSVPICLSADDGIERYPLTSEGLIF